MILARIMAIENSRERNLRPISSSSTLISVLLIIKPRMCFQNTRSVVRSSTTFRPLFTSSQLHPPRFRVYFIKYEILI